ncbi:group I truncated hemoglobin [Onishia niordana]|uniref:group I truncated hemoglobin n=1 Tax=Onishia niordana TaxID=2508711 RepID=UPI00109F41E0|nr:group 1 truncated hemoglobin [Halomonas niordiana]
MTTSSLIALGASRCAALRHAVLRGTSYPVTSKSLALYIALALGFSVLGGCAHTPPPPEGDAGQERAITAEAETEIRRADTTLYTALGGKPVIDDVVNDFLYRIADDERIRHFFVNTDIDHFQVTFATQLCDISNGPCDYQGPSMARAHQHMGLTEVHFNAIVEHLRAALIEKGVSAGPRNQLLGRLARLHDAVMLRQP